MRLLLRHTRLLLALVALLAATQYAAAAQSAQTTIAQRTATLPERLSDAEFWKLVSDISEPGGYFRMADNFVSNEQEIGTIAGMISTNGPTGGVYMGVGPEQNLTYIAAVRPKMVFIVDIRRQAVMHHLLYKAIFELARDRADFVSILFAKPRPLGLDSATSIVQMWDAFTAVTTDTAQASKNLVMLRDHLTKTHGFTFTPEEVEMFEHVQRSFVFFGPAITTSARYPGTGAPATRVIYTRPPVSGFSADSLAAALARLRGAAAQALYNGAGNSVGSGAANFMSLTSVTDATGRHNSFLGSEEAFRFIKDLHTRNLFVPNSGNFGGPKAIRAVGNYVRDRGALVTAFYVSNVEGYLFTDGLADEFYANVATLPVDEKSVFIRPGGMRGGVALCPIAAMLRAVAAGRVLANNGATLCTTG